jgi:glycosyltransferase involved in cell wall biosynthesis
LFDVKIEKNPFLILTTSSPDRHLEATLDVFEELIKRQPEKPWKLAWYYGWGVYDSVHKDNKEMMDWKTTQMARFDALKALGRAEGGNMIPHTEIAKKYLEAGVFLYATSFLEVHCISILKAQAAGCRVISSDFAALEETSKYGYKIHTDGKRWGRDNTFGDVENKDKYVEAILNYNPTEKHTKKMMEWATGVNWEFVSNEWGNILRN